MRLAAVISVWLALAVGAPQVMLGISGFFEGGWRMLACAALIVLPFGPLALRITPRLQTLPPVAVVAAALVSMIVSVAFYAWVMHVFANA